MYLQNPDHRLHCNGIYSRLCKVFAGVHRRINTVTMLIKDITTEAKASRSLCKSSKPDKELGASQLSSCKSQGLRARKSKVKHTIKHKRTSIDGKKIKGKKYGGPLPDWS